MRRLFTALYLMTASFAFAGLAQAQVKLDDDVGFAQDQPVYMSADQLGYDKERGIVVALGNVEVLQGETILLANRITYYQQKNIVKADGDVTLLEPDGNVLFARDVQLKDDLKQGVIRNFQVRMSDNSRFAALEAKKLSEGEYQLTKAVYSPCRICRDEETGEAEAPLWQLKAGEVNIDEQEQRITYRNARMELYGIPIAYTPYFSHPTPDADRKTGFLAPVYSQNGQLGNTIKVPVYFNISPDKDATVTPFYTTEEGLVLEGQYRQLTDHGFFQFDGSITNPEDRDAAGNRIPGEDEIRGHIFASGNDRLSDTMNWGFDINRATDDTYLRRYRYGNQDTLRSRIWAEHLEDRDYAIVQGLAFQGLEAQDDPDRTPFILPYAMVDFVSDPFWNGARANFEASGSVITRDLGAESRRVTMLTEIEKPFISEDGHVMEVAASVRGDAYSVSNVPTDTNTDELFEPNQVVADPGEDTFDGTVTRAIPQLALTYRYPMIKFIEDASLTLEPTAQLIVQPNGNNPSEIVNEDSLVPEFSDVNLFDRNRFAGYDRIENGTRVAYGMRGQYRFFDGDALNFLLGQDYLLYGDRLFPVADELDENYSDYVGMLGYEGEQWMLDYRFRVASDEFNFRRNELRGSMTLDPITLYADYLQIDEDPVLSDREEIFASSTIGITDNWSINAYSRRDILENQMLLAGGGLTYINECLTLVTRLDREFTRDRDIEPNTQFSVRVFLKNLN
jgi:LPS-assembly protein